MPRRNKRATFEPLDLTPEVRRPLPTVGSVDPVQARRERAMRREEAEKRQRDARINHGIDWSVCLVPGCGDELVTYGRLQHERPEQRDHETVLPLCTRHLSVAYQQANYRANDALMVKANTLLLEQKAAKRKALEKQITEEWRQRTDGDIYFVRLNGLVKVGWSRDVDQRLRAYGPDVEVLAIYPGSRDDETNLHRQLRPVLARGREWYEDCKIIADFVAQAIAKHGEPEVYSSWTRPKQIIRPRKRAS